MKEGLELAGVQMTPCALWRMVVHGKLALALGAAEPAVGAMLHVHMDLFTSHLHVHPGNRPRATKAKDVLVKSRTVHRETMPSTEQKVYIKPLNPQTSRLCHP